jgi:4-amino-4-deoxy-L-arabinose transferase-like glycosyltransferase
MELPSPTGAVGVVAVRNRLRTPLALAGLLALALAGDLLSLRSDEGMPNCDEAHHLTVGLSYARAITGGSFLHQLWRIPERYPPAFHILVGLGMIFLGPSDRTGLVVNFAAMALLLWATSRLASRTFGQRAGLLAAALLVFLPVTVCLHRITYQECTVTAAVALSLALLLDADASLSSAGALALGLAMGVGLLLKPTFGFFVWAPGLAVAGRAALRRDRPRVVRLALAALLAVALAGLWYLPHWQDILALAADNRVDALRWGHARSPVAGLSYYLARLPWMLERPVLALAAVALVWSVLRRWRRCWLLHAALWGGLAMTVGGLVFRDEKYLFPMMPLLAIVCAGLLAEFGRIGAVATAILCASYAGLAVAYAPANRPSVELTLGDRSFILLSTEYYRRLPRWTTPRIAAASQAHAPRPDARVAVVPDWAMLNANQLTWESRRVGSPLEYTFVGSHLRELDFRADDLRRFDLVITKTGVQGDPENTERSLDFMRFVEEHPDVFHEVERFDLPDRTISRLYQVRGSALGPVEASRIEGLVAASDARFRDLDFAGRYRLLGFELAEAVRGKRLRLAWQSVPRQPLDAKIGVHLTDDEGNIFTGVDYPLDPRQGTVEAGARWIDEVFLSESALSRARWLGLCVYRPEGRFALANGPQRWHDWRVSIPLAGQEIPGGASARGPEQDVGELVARSSPRWRDLSFGDQYRLLGLELSRDPRGRVLRIAWESSREQALDASVCLHLTDDEGRILDSLDHPMDRARRTVRANERWIGEVVLPRDVPAGARWIGLCVFRPEGRLPLAGGPQRWKDWRVSVPLFEETGAP